jgi:ankyrin repeat protein
MTIMKLLITRCTYLDNRDAKVKTTLHWVVHGGCVDVQELLRNGASVKVRNKKRRMPLPAAVMGDMIDDMKKKEAIVKMLLKYGVDPKTKDGKGKALLQRMSLGGLGGIGRVFAEAKGLGLISSARSVPSFHLDVEIEDTDPLGRKAIF